MCQPERIRFPLKTFFIVRLISGASSTIIIFLVPVIDLTFDGDIIHRLPVFEESKKGFPYIDITLQILKE